MKVKWYLADTDYPQGVHDGEIEVADDATDEEIEEEVREVAFGYIDWGWRKKND